MKADRNDAPRYLHRKRTAEAGKWLAAGVIGTSVALSLLYLAGVNLPLLQDPKPAAQAQQQHYEQSSLPPFVDTDPTQPKAEDMFWANVKKQEQQTRARQTDFNDHNYTPRQPDNVVSMEGVRQSIAYEQNAQPSTTRRRNVESDSHWVDKWSGGGQYLAHWNVVNNYIDGGSVCGNHKRGSIDYRECRKGAKQYFKQACRKWESRYQSDREVRSDWLKQRYCSAASSFSPMG